MRRRRRKERLVWDPDRGVLELVRVLLLLQGSFALLSTLEVVLVGLGTGTLALLETAVALTAGVAVAFLALAAGLRRRWYRARRLVILLEVVLLVGALADLALAIFMAGEPLNLVATLTRLVLPVGVIVLLRKARTRVPAVPAAARA